MKENDTKTTGVNYNIWKDKFLPKGKDPSDDYLPPEVKTYCKVVDGISRDNNINLLVVPIYVPDKQNDGKNIGQTIGGNIYLQCNELMTEKSNNEYYSNINEKYKDLVDKEQSFGVIYVYHNKYCIKHCDGFVYHKNKDEVMVFYIDYTTNIEKVLPIDGRPSYIG